MNYLQIKNLQKTYANGVTALQDISLELSNGMFGLLGANGAGKSTLMKTIVGLQKPDNGQIIFNGVDVVVQPDFLKKQLGFLPQDFGVYPKISAMDLLTHLAILKGVPATKARKEQILALLDKVNLYTQRHQAVSTFSGGMKQRFGIAQALLGNPQLIIVDEPTAGLDPEERNRFNNLLSEIGEEVIVMLSTHLVEDVKNLCTQMAIIHQGTILAQGNPQDFVQELVGKIWQKTIDKKEKEYYEANYQVVASQLQAGKLLVQVYATQNPQDGFEAIAPSLELAYFRQRDISGTQTTLKEQVKPRF